MSDGNFFLFSPLHVFSSRKLTRENVKANSWNSLGASRKWYVQKNVWDRIFFHKAHVQPFEKNPSFISYETKFISTNIQRLWIIRNSRILTGRTTHRSPWKNFYGARSSKNRATFWLKMKEFLIGSLRAIFYFRRPKTVLITNFVIIVPYCDQDSWT